MCIRDSPTVVACQTHLVVEPVVMHMATELLVVRLDIVTLNLFRLDGLAVLHSLQEHCSCLLTTVCSAVLVTQVCSLVVEELVLATTTAAATKLVVVQLV